MRFDAYAALAELRSEGGGRAIRATCAIQRAPLPGLNSTNSMNSTDRPANAAQSDAIPCSTNSMNSTGQAVQSANVTPLPPHIAAAVLAAFTDYAATTDPFDQRAWV